MKLLVVVCLVAYVTSEYSFEYHQQQIDLVNRVNSDKSSTWTAEVRPGHEGVRPPRGGVTVDSNVPIIDESHHIFKRMLPRAEIPESYDPRTLYPCVAFKASNHGSCGSCYAWAAAHFASLRTCINSQGQYNTFFSPQDLMQCSGKCEGGLSETTVNLMKQSDAKLGPLACTPYSENANKAGPCKSGQCTNMLLYTPSGTNTFSKIDQSVPAATRVQNMQSEILQNGPTPFYLYWEELGQYKGGVYVSTTGSKDSTQKYGNINHAVTLIGWGTTPATEKPGVDYWIALNSHGADYGESGYFRIRRGTNEAQCESFVSKPDRAVATPVTDCVAQGKSCVNGNFASDCSCICATGWIGASCSECGIQCKNGGTPSTVVPAELLLVPNMKINYCSCTCVPGSGFLGPDCSDTFAVDATSYSIVNSYATVKLAFTGATDYSTSRYAVVDATTGKDIVATYKTGYVGGVPSMCPSGTCSSPVTIMFTAAPGKYYVQLLRYNGVNEFGVSKGYARPTAFRSQDFTTVFAAQPADDWYFVQGIASGLGYRYSGPGSPEDAPHTQFNGDAACQTALRTFLSTYIEIPSASLRATDGGSEAWVNAYKDAVNAFNSLLGPAPQACEYIGRQYYAEALKGMWQKWQETTRRGFTQADYTSLSGMTGKAFFSQWLAYEAAGASGVGANQGTIQQMGVSFGKFLLDVENIAIPTLRSDHHLMVRATPPGAWTCAAADYDSGDTCDCGCGAVDPDCATTFELNGCPVAAAGTAARCSATGTCTTVTIPAAWTCDDDVYASGISCDCGCGATDPDCAIAPALAVEGCDLGPGPTCNAGVCAYSGPSAPSGWKCDWQAYNAGDACDCDCGVADPDCTNTANARSTFITGCPCPAMGCTAGFCTGTCKGYEITLSAAKDPNANQVTEGLGLALETSIQTPQDYCTNVVGYRSPSSCGTKSPNDVPIGLGVGLGVGIPAAIAALAVAYLCGRHARPRTAAVPKMASLDAAPSNATFTNSYPESPESSSYKSYGSSEGSGGYGGESGSGEY